jgi:asparagine synthase (glutamine-hydrolysing)
MCGIAGIVTLREGLPPPSRAALTRMASALRHRGPDEHGIYRDRRAGLAHARLSIIDLSSGQQPMGNEDGSLWVVYNGEIFNYVELRAELASLGHVFRTQSDTEVILHAYESWGDRAFARFNGQFALALWDAARAALVLARDRLGVRPLYVCEHEGRLFFASEVKAIFAASAAIPRAFDPIGLDQTFTFWSVVAPRTVFAGVEEIPPGHARTYVRGERRERAFAEVRFPEGGAGFTGSLDEAVEAVRASLREATRLRMLRADVPVGSYLSGGLDSSLVAALGLEAKGGQRFSTFSLRFEDAEYDETSFQRLVAARLGTEHHEVVVSRRDIAAVFPDVVFHAERPLLRTAPAPLFLLSRLVRDSGIKVVLTGEGADEVFAGYDLFREGKIRRFWARHPDSTRRPLLLSRLYPYLARSPVAQQAIARQFFGQHLDQAGEPGFAHDPRWRSTAALKRLFSPALLAALDGRDARADLLAALPPEIRRWTPLAQDQFLEMRTLLAGYILSSQGDRMLMAHGVEGRFPFLDAGVVALAASLPPSFKLRVLDEKHVLKRVAKDLVPEAIIARRKQPYRAPDALSFVGEGAPAWIEEAMSTRAIAAAGVFHPPAVAQLWRKCRAAGGAGQFSNADNMALTGILSTQLVHALLVDRPALAKPVEPRTIVDRLEPAPLPAPAWGAPLAGA